MSFPHGVMRTLERVHPTPLYECLVSLLIALCLWQLGSPKLRARVPLGAVCAWGLISTGAMRFMVEFIRANPRLLLGLTEAQMSSIVSIIVGIVLLRSRGLRHPALLQSCLSSSPARSPRP